VLLDHITDGTDTDPDWIALLARHPDRFVVGSDTVASADTVDTRARQIHALLEALPDPAARCVAEDNAQALWFP
jgi:hypothetical protein